MQKSIRIGTRAIQDFSHVIQSLRLQQGKRLGASGDVASGCVQWLEQNYHIYEAILQGSSGLSDQDQAQFLDWYRYAAQATSAGGGTWGESVENPAATSGHASPPGAKLGPNGNYVFNGASAEFTYREGVAQAIDVLSDELELNIAVKAKVHVEQTVDTRVAPSQEVYRITIFDPASVPQETVLYCDLDTKIRIATIGAKDVTFAGGIEKGITVVPFEEGSENVASESSIAGIENEQGGFDYEGTIGEVIDFWPQANEKGETQTHHVWGDANISVGASDHVFVQHLGDSLMISVRHTNGSQDTFIVEKGFKVNLNAHAPFVKFGGAAEGEAMPEDFAARLSLNGGVETGNSASGDAILEHLFSLAKGQKSETQLANALHAAGFTEITDVDSLHAAIRDQSFPPALPGGLERLKAFFKIWDASYRAKADAANDLAGYQALMQRCCDLLEPLYPERNFSVSAKIEEGYGSVNLLIENQSLWSLTKAKGDSGGAAPPIVEGVPAPDAEGGI